MSDPLTPVPTPPQETLDQQSWVRRLASRLSQLVKRRREAEQTAKGPVRKKPPVDQEFLPLVRPVEGKRPMRKIAIINHKGGVGKTSTTVHLSGSLAAMGYRVLICDCDSQGDLSSIYLTDHEALPYSIADIFGGRGLPTADLVQPTFHDNIFVIPADARLNQVDKTHGFEEDPNVQALADAVSQVEAEFDFIIFDCPPRPHLSSFAALIAATEVLIPCQASQFSVRSMAKLLQEIDLAKRSLNPQLKIAGYFLSMVSSRSSTQQKYREMLVEALGEELVLKTAIPVMATFESAINYGKPVSIHSPKSKAAQVMSAFAMELIGSTL
jgi:chromosome partitioning protein